MPILLHGSLNASWYTLEDAAPGVVASAGFQPLNDYGLAALWCLAAWLAPSIFPMSEDPEQG